MKCPDAFYHKRCSLLTSVMLTVCLFLSRLQILAEADRILKARGLTDEEIESYGEDRLRERQREEEREAARKREREGMERDREKQRQQRQQQRIWERGEEGEHRQVEEGEGERGRGRGGEVAGGVAPRTQVSCVMGGTHAERNLGCFIHKLSSGFNPAIVTLDCIRGHIASLPVPPTVS